MTVAERMRKDGWYYDMGDWSRRVCGVLVVVYRVDANESCMETHTQDDGERWYQWRRRVGLRDLAQRAKAAARRLARKGKR